MRTRGGGRRVKKHSFLRTYTNWLTSRGNPPRNKENPATGITVIVVGGRGRRPFLGGFLVWVCFCFLCWS